MALAVQPIFQAKAREHGLPESSERFQNDFITATNRAVGELNRALQLATPISRIASTDATIAELSDSDEWMLTAGITRWLVEIGIGAEREDKAGAIAAWEDAKAAFQAYTVTALDTAETDAAGLGYLE